MDLITGRDERLLRRLNLLLFYQDVIRIEGGQGEDGHPRSRQHRRDSRQHPDKIKIQRPLNLETDPARIGFIALDLDSSSRSGVKARVQPKSARISWKSKRLGPESPITTVP